MYLLDANKTAFMANGPTYYYQYMSFGLKNVGATYQRLMDKVFTNHISNNLKVYMVLRRDLRQKYDMRLNLDNPNQPPHLLGAAKSQAGQKDDGPISGTI
ncbi:hypothetical protein CR513_17059, partial [Mucuna pruriens]